MNINLFNLLKLNSKLHDWENLHSDFNFIPIFKLFNEIFDLKNLSDVRLAYFSKNYNEIRNFSSIDWGNDSLLIYNFLEIEHLHNIRDRIYDHTCDYNYLEYLPIADCAFSQFLLIGISENNRDKIYIEDYDSDEITICVAENIFQLFKNAKIIPKINVEGKELSKFYKNFNEDFWRIKED